MSRPGAGAGGRWVPIVIGIAVAGALGVRPNTLRASPWSEARFSGEGRSHIIVRAVPGGVAADLGAPDGPGVLVAEAFARMIFTTDASAFGPGLMLRSSFPIPNTGRSAVVILDLNRGRDRSVWAANEGDLLLGRYYEVPTGGAQPSYDGGAEDGELVLERVVIGERVVGFRISGAVTFVAAGADELVGTPDDDVRHVTIVLETTPGPEAVEPSAGGGSPLPVVGVCETELCYEDPYYADGGGGGCGGGAVVDDLAFEPNGAGCGAEPDSGDGGYASYDEEAPTGCEGDSTDDGSWDGSSGGFDDGSTGCESDSTDDGSWDDASGGFDDGSSGCESDATDDGWGDAGEACSGDTVAATAGRRAPGPWVQAERRGPRGALIAWTPFLLLLGGVLLVHRRR